jgi:hypothetical protein
MPLRICTSDTNMWRRQSSYVQVRNNKVYRHGEHSRQQAHSYTRCSGRETACCLYAGLDRPWCKRRQVLSSPQIAALLLLLLLPSRRLTVSQGCCLRCCSTCCATAAADHSLVIPSCNTGSSTTTAVAYQHLLVWLGCERTRRKHHGRRAAVANCCRWSVCRH